MLSESQSILGVLRQNESLQPSQPAPAPLDLASTIEAGRTLGVAVTVNGSTALTELTPLARHAAHRFVQEAITNAGKHAAHAPVTVGIAHGESLRIEVRNPSSAPNGPTRMGLGLIGMRERLAAAGGTLAVAHGNEQFSVTAELPHNDQGDEVIR